MKIVVLDGYTLNPGDLSWDGLSELGNCDVYKRTKPEDIIDRIGGAEIVLTNKVIIDKTVFETAKNLRYVGVLATGYNVVDVEEASKKGVIVTNIPAYSTDSVAQIVFSHILTYCNRVELHTNSVVNREWENCIDFSYSKSPQFELTGKTIGIVGFGRIGQRVAEIALAFGMKVIFQNRSVKNIQDKNIEQVDLETLFAQSDFISLNCPLTNENSEFVNFELISLMKPTAMLINTGRGGLINETDLADALNNEKIACAAVDVLSTEPPKTENPLLSAKNIFITPHIAWATVEARKRLMKIAVENVKKYLLGDPQNVVS